jgi:transcriptional regulator with XRE-family HTH domain
VRRNFGQVQSSEIGEFIKGLRENARISLRQLADQAGVSNPYLSQIERGLRKPSAEVLAQIAGALRVSTPVMYLRAGLLGTEDGPGVLSAIAADPVLSMAQKQSLTQIYETFVRENARHEAETGEPVAAQPTATRRRVNGSAAARQPDDVAVARKRTPSVAAAEVDGEPVTSDSTGRPTAAAPEAEPAAPRVAAKPRRRATSTKSVDTSDTADTAHVQEDKS